MLTSCCNAVFFCLFNLLYILRLINKILFIAVHNYGDRGLVESFLTTTNLFAVHTYGDRTQGHTSPKTQNTRKARCQPKQTKTNENANTNIQTLMKQSSVCCGGDEAVRYSDTNRYVCMENRQLRMQMLDIIGKSECNGVEWPKNWSISATDRYILKTSSTI